MAYRTRINYTVAQKTEMWDRWQQGETLNAIGRVFIVAGGGQTIAARRMFRVK